ncbi:MAG: hypothetical protein ACFB0B_16035 [Thermonemataceae bacterium]
MINHWGCNEDYNRATYTLSIPKRSYNHSFLEKLLRINEKHVVHKLICKDKGDPIELYMNDLNKYEKKNIIALRFTAINQKTYQFKYNSVYKIYLYDEKGALIERTIDLMGPILRKLNDPEDSKTEMGYTGPLWMWSSGFNGNRLDFYVEIHSDIYFPVVNQKFKISEELYPNQKWVDNTELATLNTRIFNNWFRELTELFRKNDGRVNIGGLSGISKENKVELTEEGIVHLI